MEQSIINPESQEVVVYGLPNVTEMVEFVKEVVKSSRFIYKKSRYERGRARDIAEMRSDWGEFCRDHDIGPEKLRDSVRWIITTSHLTHPKFERIRITNCETFWRYWSDVYNRAVDLQAMKKSNEQYHAERAASKKPLSVRAEL